MSEDSQSIKSILTKLEEGKKLTLSFPSPKERELFRVALHKAKRQVDEVFLMTDPSYEIEALNFVKSQDEENPHDISYQASMQLVQKQDLPKRGYSFSIVGEEDGDNNHEHANPTGVIDSP